MSNSRYWTLREVLDYLNVESGDDRGFILYKDDNTCMNVSRRYIESEPWRYVLDWYVVDASEEYDIYGCKTTSFTIVESI